MKNIAVITGASAGLGREFVRQIRLSKDKYDEIWLIARREQPMKELASMYPDQNFRIILLDLKSESSHDFYRELLEKEEPIIRLLINNAGFGKTGKFSRLSYEDQIDMIKLNIQAVTALTHISLEYMTFGCKIINIASAAAFAPQPYFAVYAATKSYVLSFTRAIRRELKPRGIRVLAVCPGPVETEFMEVAGAGENFKQFLFKVPEEVVKAALKDLKRGRELSVCGIPMKLSRIMAKIIPHSLFLGIFKEPK